MASELLGAVLGLADAVAEVSGLFKMKGSYDASTNAPDLDVAPSSAIASGDAYVVTVSGDFFVTPVEVGDVLLANVDGPTQEADWAVVQGDIDYASLVADLAARLKVDGSVAMTGGLDVGGHAVTNVSQVGSLVPTAAGVKALYEGNADTNAFTDADKAKLAGVEAGATADQTGAEIKSIYEGNADTNAFTDAASSKLAGIEAGATADQTGPEIVAAIDTQLGSTDWKTGGGGGDVVADSLVVDGLVRTKAVVLTGPTEATGEPGVIYYADLRTGDVNVLAPDLPQAGDTLRGEVIATGPGVLTLCGVAVSSSGGAVQRFPAVAGVPSAWRLAGDAP